MSEQIKNDADKAPNPGSKDSKPSVVQRKRIPMSIPRQRLALPEIPGYHCHWFMGLPDRVQAALEAGYEFIKPEEVYVNPTALGSSVLQSGNTDQGSRVSIVAGGDLGVDGQAQRLYAMKIKKEFWLEDQKLLEDQNDRVASSLAGHITTGRPVQGVEGMGSAPGESATDASRRYAKGGKVPELFQKGAMARRLRP